MIIKEPVHEGIVKQGKFIPDDAEFLKYDFDSFEGLRVEIKVRETVRGDDFNRYYWRYVVKIFTDFFNKEKSFGRIVRKEFVHELLTAKFLGFTQQTLPGGEILMMRTPTRSLSKSDFRDYVKYCKSWGEEFFNLTFPDKKTTPSTPNLKIKR